jgi:uncharacterized protein
MLTSQDQAKNILVTCYDQTSITIAQTCYRESILLCPGHGAKLWPDVIFGQLSFSHINQLIDYPINKPKIIIIGCGEQQQWLAPELTGHCHQLGIGMEIMPTPAACRTYNLLATDEHLVVAALFI